MRTRNFTLPLLVAAVAGVAAGCGGGGGDSKLKNGINPGGGGGGTSSNVNSATTPVGSLATGRVHHTATYIPQVEKVLIAGGKGRAGTTDVVLDSAELFDPRTGQFTPIQGRLSGGRQTGQNGRMAHSALALPNAKVLIAGGQTDVAGTTSLNSCEVYNALASSAQFGPVSGNPLAEAKSESVLFLFTPATGGTPEVAIAGGRKRVGSVDQALTTVNFYKPDSNSILAGTMPSLRQARFGAEAMPMASGANPQLAIAGGTSNGSTLAGFEVFDPATKTFTTSGANAHNRRGGDGVVLGGVPALVGGVDVSGQTIDSIEFMSSGSWTDVTARLKTPRSLHTATKLENGDVLVIGGVGPFGQVVDTIELISGSGVGASIQELTARLRTPRKNHTATYMKVRINNIDTEMVLIAGGEDSSGAPIASAEVWTISGATVPVVTPCVTTPPSIASIAPAQGPIGTQVTINGANFASAPAQNIVKFNGLLAPVQTVNGGAMTVNVPQGLPAGFADVTVTVGNQTSPLGPTARFNVTTGSTPPPGGGGTSGPPRIFITLPMSGPAFMPLGVGGTNFNTGMVPYVNGIPSIAIFTFSIQNIPLLGSVAVGMTIVPPAAPMGPGDVVLDYLGQRSNPFPFTVN